MKNVDFKKVLELAESYKPDITKFLRDMIAIPSESCDEEKVVLRIILINLNQLKKGAK